MRKSKRDKLEPDLTHKIQSKLLISSKQTSTLSANILSKIDHIRHQQDLQRQYNLKFMTDRKKPLSTQKSQKSLSSSKVTHKETKTKPVLIAQKLVFQSEDYRKRYYDLHDQYIEQRQKNMQWSQKIFKIKQNICSFINSPESRTADQLSRQLNCEKTREILKKAIQQRRRVDMSENILKQVMKILQVNIWQDIVNNLRARVQRFRTLDECTFRILELQSINKHIVNEFEDKLKNIKQQQQQSWQKQRQNFNKQVQSFRKNQQNKIQEGDIYKKKYQNILLDIKQINSTDVPRLISGCTQLIELQQNIYGLKKKLQQIEIEAEENIYKLLKSNQQMVRFQRNIQNLRGQMQEQIQQLQIKNKQNQGQINKLQINLQQSENSIFQLNELIKKLQMQKNKLCQQSKDQYTLFAQALSIQQTHPAKLLLKIKQILQNLHDSQLRCKQLKSIISDKDGLSNDLQIQMSRLNKCLQEREQTSKIALYEKQQYKFLLNNLRDQVSQMKKQHNEQKCRIIRQKDEQIILSNRQILQSHGLLNEQLSELKIIYTKLKRQYEQCNNNNLLYRNKLQKLQRQLIQKQGVIKKLSSEYQRIKNQLRQIQGSFRQVVELQQITSKKLLNLQKQKLQNIKLITIIQQNNGQLQKINIQLNKQKNELNMNLSKLIIDIKQLKDDRNKIQSINIQLRLELLNKKSQVIKLQQKIKLYQNQIILLKNNNQKYIYQINCITKKFISSKIQIKKYIKEKLKIIIIQIKSIYQEILRIEKYISTSSTNNKLYIQSTINQIIEYIHRYYNQQIISSPQSQHTYTQCLIQPSNINQILNTKLTQILTTVSLLRRQKNDILQEINLLQDWNFIEIYHNAYDDHKTFKLKKMQGSIEMICQQSIEQSQLRQSDTAKIYTPQEIFSYKNQQQAINYVLQTLLDQDQIPSLPYWSKIQSNFLTIRRKFNKKNNLKLDISAIDYRDPSIGSPQSSCHHQSQFIRRLASEPDDPLEIRETNRSQRIQTAQNLRKDNEELRAKYQETLMRYNQQHEQLLSLQGKLVKLQNQTSIVGLEHNFKRIIQYFLAENIDLFLQSCRIVMKMLHFTDLQIKDFENKTQAKRKKKKGGLFQFFKT